MNYSKIDPQDLPLKLHEAIRFAEEKHRGQVRKGTDIAYIIHPMEVLQILMGQDCGIEVAIAGILHDVLEDTDGTGDEIEARFGSRVRFLIEAHTEKKEEGSKKRPWKIRKEEDLETLRKSDNDVKQIVLADSISNLRSMVYDYGQLGEKLWERFNAGKEDIRWYYNEKIDAFEELQCDENMRHEYWELNSLFKHLFVDYYLEENGASLTIYQDMGDELYALENSSILMWKSVDAVPDGVKKLSKQEAEHLEDTWREMAQ